MAWTRRLKEVLKKNVNQPPEVYLAVAVGAGQISTVTWAVADKTIDIFGQGAASFNAEEDLLAAIEPAAKLALDSETPKKFFIGVPPEWISQGKFSKGRESLLQEVSNLLEMPLGGVVPTIESLAAYLKSLKAITAAVLIEVGRFQLRVSLMSAGRALPSLQADREDENLGETIEALFNKIGFKTPLPSRLILYGPGALEENRQEILEYSWPEEIFPHAPSVSLLEDAVLAEAVAYVSAINMHRLTPYLERAHLEKLPRKSDLKGGHQTDVDKERVWATQPEIDPVGYQLDQDVIAEPVSLPVSQEELSSPPQKAISDRLNSVKGVFASIIGSIPSLCPGGRIPLLSGLTLGVFLAGGFVVLGLPRAQVTLLVQPQIFKGSFPLLMTTRNLGREGERVVKMIKREFDLEGEKEMPTTGVKLIGESAKGEVVVYNRTPIAKTFAAGNILLGSGGLKFALDSPVTVDAATVATSAGSETKTYGRAKIGLTASEIGAEGNLSGSSRFSFLSYSEEQYFAENEEAFSGGSSREVKVVTKDDQENITRELQGELRQRAIDLINQEVEANLRPIEEWVDLTITEKEFNAKPDEEIDNLGLKVKAKAFGYLYHHAEVLTLIETEVKKQTQDGYQVVKDQIKFDLSYEGLEEEETRAQVNFETTILPDFDQDKIKREISGKKPEAAKEILQTFPHIEGVRIEIWPGWLPKAVLRMPPIRKRIEVEVTRG